MELKRLTVVANAGGVGFELSQRIKPEGYQDLGILFQNNLVKNLSDPCRPWWNAPNLSS